MDAILSAEQMYEVVLRINAHIVPLLNEELFNRLHDNVLTMQSYHANPRKPAGCRVYCDLLLLRLDKLLNESMDVTSQKWRILLRDIDYCLFGRDIAWTNTPDLPSPLSIAMNDIVTPLKMYALYLKVERALQLLLHIDFYSNVSRKARLLRDMHGRPDAGAGTNIWCQRLLGLIDLMLEDRVPIYDKQWEHFEEEMKLYVQYA